VDRLDPLRPPFSDHEMRPSPGIEVADLRPSSHRRKLETCICSFYPSFFSTKKMSPLALHLETIAELASPPSASSRERWVLHRHSPLSWSPPPSYIHPNCPDVIAREAHTVPASQKTTSSKPSSPSFLFFLPRNCLYDGRRIEAIIVLSPPLSPLNGSHRFPSIWLFPPGAKVVTTP